MALIPPRLSVSLQDRSGWCVCLWPKQWEPHKCSSLVTRSFPTSLSTETTRLNDAITDSLTPNMFLFSFPCADLFSERLVMAKELGADFQLLVKREDEPKQLAKRVEDMLGAQPHVTIECTGAESCVQTGIYVSVLLDILKHARRRLCKQQTMLYLHLIVVSEEFALSDFSYRCFHQ